MRRGRAKRGEGWTIQGEGGQYREREGNTGRGRAIGQHREREDKGRVLNCHSYEHSFSLCLVDLLESKHALAD